MLLNLSSNGKSYVLCLGIAPVSIISDTIFGQIIQPNTRLFIVDSSEVRLQGNIFWCKGMLIKTKLMQQYICQVLYDKLLCFSIQKGRSLTSVLNTGTELVKVQKPIFCYKRDVIYYFCLSVVKSRTD